MHAPSSYEYYRDAIAGRRLPLALLDLDALRINAAEVVHRAGGKPVRVATKSVRSVDVLRLIAETSPSFQGLMAYSAAEAAWLTEQGFDDVFVGYPTFEPDDIAAVCRAIAGGKRIGLTIDEPTHVERLSQLARQHGVVLPVVIDVDMSSSYPGLHFGVRRSPLRGANEVLSLARRVAARPELTLDGLLAYEAQIAGVPDAVPGSPVMNAVVRLLKRHSLPEVLERRGTCVAALAREGFRLRFVNGGGTGSLVPTAADPSVSELTAGSAFYAPALFDGFRDFRYRAAAMFAVPVTRLPEQRLITCHGGGFVASGSAGPEKLPRPYLPAGLRLLGREGAGEVQTPLALPEDVSLELGAPVFFRHAKAGELCEHFQTLLLVEGGKIVGEATTYRGSGMSF